MTATLNDGQRRRLTLARRLLDRARESLNDHGIFGPWHAVVEACEAEELVLLVVAEIRSVPTFNKQQRPLMFGGLIDELKSKSPTVQRWERQLYRLSDHRVNAKHKGMIPSAHDARSAVD